ncbi:MAG: hypothetical protein ACLT38_11570 [Akkermansia sp.]
MEPRAVIDEVKKSGLAAVAARGLTGVKWTFIPPNNTKPVYLVCNCDESEPGTFKDRYIVHQDPHQLIEGMVSPATRWGRIRLTSICAKNFPSPWKSCSKFQEARERGFLGSNIQGSGYNLEIHLHRGAERTFAVRKRPCSTPLKGIAPIPASSPLLPAAIGLYGCPTIVNNVESLCQVKHIMAMGGEAYSQEGAKRSPAPASSGFPATSNVLGSMKSSPAPWTSVNCCMTSAAARGTGASSRP